ncbi:Maf family nucleotide pyrophosphatase [Brumimicrobium mesophilum]|uniref:Maf family nucleotide pyrophosphatase n=1 Tax=Brumimicrobium mesophilum TaxID=392717 RepID=UPI000D13EC1B|nr:Maf family protein [Brumimicrobium mesophilum]
MFTKKIILGSASPRRKQLVEQLDIECEIRKKEVDEVFPDTLSHYDVPEYLSKLKAEPLKKSIKKDEVLLTSDTVVIHKNQILEKPKDFQDAVQMLEKLSNSTNEVVTGVHLFNPNYEKSFSVRTKVFFKELTEEEIEYYVNKYEPYDKAGAYGIQEWIGMIGVEKIEGCFYNVMGLPVNELWKVLNEEFSGE